MVETNDKGLETSEKVSKKTEDLEGIFDSSFSQSQSQVSNKDEVEAVPDEPELIEPEKEDEVVEEESQGKSEKKDTPETTSYYDEDGYLVTKVAEKPKAKPKPKLKARASPAPASTPAAKKAKTSGAKQQSSLMSFFGKK